MEFSILVKSYTWRTISANIWLWKTKQLRIAKSRELKFAVPHNETRFCVLLNKKLEYIEFTRWGYALYEIVSMVRDFQLEYVLQHFSRLWNMKTQSKWRNYWRHTTWTLTSMYFFSFAVLCADLQTHLGQMYSSSLPPLSRNLTIFLVRCIADFIVEGRPYLYKIILHP